MQISRIGFRAEPCAFFRNVRSGNDAGPAAAFAPQRYYLQLTLIPSHFLTAPLLRGATKLSATPARPT